MFAQQTTWGKGAMKFDELEDIKLEEAVVSLANQKAEIDISLLLGLVEVTTRKIDLRGGYSGIYDYCNRKLKLTKGQANKRAQAVKTIKVAPEVIQLLRDGKTHIAHLALLAPRITSMNKEKILKFLPGMSKLALSLKLQTIDGAGNEVDIDPVLELLLGFTGEMLEKLARAQALLAQSGGQSTREKALDRSLDALLEKIDPVKKQERKKKREARKRDGSPSPSKKKAEIKGKVRPRVSSAKTKAARLARDGYQCTFIGTLGVRCSEKGALTGDHVIPWSHGGSNALENARTLCSAHNLFEAERILGLEFMEKKISSRRRAASKRRASANKIIPGIKEPIGT